MKQRPENFKAADEDPEATLVSPRFDANDARRANPVVPLAAATTTYTNAPRIRRARTTRRAWAPALLAVALLAVAALGGALVTQVMRSPRAQQAEEQTPAAPVQTVEAPPQPSTPAVAEAVRAEAPAATPAPRNQRTRRALVADVLAPAREVADDDGYEEARDKKAEKRREHDEDEVEKEIRKASKRVKQGKAARLVDVFTRP